MRKRLPLTGAYNTRSSASDISKDVRFSNCFSITVPDEIAGTKRYYVQKRCGPATSTTPAAGSKGYAIHDWNGNSIIAAFGTTNSAIWDATNLTSLGTISGQCIAINDTFISDTATLTVSSNNGKHYYQQTAGPLTEITDSDFPGNAGRTVAGFAAHMDGYMFVMDTTGRVYNSDLNSVSAWTANNYITADAVKDTGKTVVRNRNHLLALCRNHFEVFRNAGNATGSPLEKVEHLGQSIGCISQAGVTRIGDTVFWVGVGKDGTTALYSYDAGVVTRVSNAQLSALITETSSILFSTMGLSSLAMFGRTFVVVNGSTTSLAYCLEEKAWCELSGTERWWKSAGVGTGSIFTISRESTSGKVYVWNPRGIVYTDDGDTITSTIRTGKFDNGNSKRKFWNELWVVGDKATTTSPVTVAYSDDDYVTTLTKGTIDLANNDPHISGLGSSKRRAWQLTHTAAAEFRLEALELDFLEEA